MTSPQTTGAHLIASSLVALDVSVIFGIVGIPVIEVAEACIAAGIRFISFRNEQAASYAASAYGYLTGRPGVCLVVGGPGVLHAMAGVGNSMVNATFPLLLLAGSAPTTDLATKGAFQQLDQVALLAPHTKLALRPPTLSQLPAALRDAYRTAFYGRPGATYVDLPADYIQAVYSAAPNIAAIPPPPSQLGDPARIAAIAAALRAAKAPLIIIGKGAAYSRAEHVLREFVDTTQIPFLPTPQGKGVIPDSHALNTSTARSAALKGADFVLLLGARLNWILHFGTRFNPAAKIAQVDISPEELGRNGLDPALSVVGDIPAVVQQLRAAVQGLRHPADSEWRAALRASADRNTKKARKLEGEITRPGQRLGYQRVFRLIEDTLLRHAATGPEELVYVSEGANTMDISRSIFSIAAPRQRLDAGTYATMGVGLGYAVAAELAYNYPVQTKRVVAIEGDSALGFSLAEIETMARYRLNTIVVVMNNGGVYHGIADDTREFGEKWESDERRRQGTLPSTALGFETAYHTVAQGLGARGYRVETEDELVKAVTEAWRYTDGPTLINVIIRSGAGGALSFGWLEKKEEAKL
jgi:2-hydroxyacyl-CoA lyase 1